MEKIKRILFLLMIFSMFSCVKNIKTDNKTNPYLSIFYSETGTDSSIKINGRKLSSFSVDEKPLVKSVDINGRAFSDLSPLTSLTDLEELSILSNDYLYDITPLASLVNLKKLSINICDNIKSIKPISALVNLEYLSLDFNDTYYEELASLRNLEFLRLSTSFAGTKEIDVVYIAKLTLLKELSITAGYPYNYLGKIKNINLLKNLVNLESLAFCNVDPDISWITGLKKLRKFKIELGYIEDLKPLLELPDLVEVDVSFSEIEDVSVFLESKTLKKVTGPLIMDNELLAKFAEKGIEYIASYSDR